MYKHLLVASLLAGATLAPLGAAPASAQSTGSIVLQVDRPKTSEQIEASGSFGGWAIDQSAYGNPGITRVSVFVDGDATTGHYVGDAQLGGVRPDVAAQYGNGGFTNSGWNFSLNNTGLTGQHSFTFVAVGVGGAAVTESVGTVTVLPAPLNYAAAQLYTPDELAPGYPAYSTYSPAPPPGAFLSPAPAVPVGGVPVGGIPIGGVPGAIAPIPVSISLSAPTNGVTQGTSFQVSGMTSAAPFAGAISYRLTDANGAQLAAGNLSVNATAGQVGSFSGTVTAPAGARGPATLTVTQTERGTVVGTTSASVTLIGSATPPLPPYYVPTTWPR